MFDIWKSKNIGVSSLHLINGLITFSFAVLFSSLLLYLTNTQGFSKTEANAYVGMFLAFNFALHLVSGYIGGNYISNRLLLLVSCVFQALGSYVLSWSSPYYLLFGLSLFIIGCGINSTSVKLILTQLLEGDESRREMAFFINYAAVNAGFLLGFFASGYYDLSSKYQNLFNLCNVFNVVSIILVMISWRFLKDPKKSKINNGIGKVYFTVATMSILIVGLMAGFNYPFLSNGIVVSLGGLCVFYLVYQIQHTNCVVEKKNISSFIILTLSSIVFWSLYFVGPMGVTYFMKFNVQREVFGVIIPPQWYMNLNAVFVILGAPLMGMFLKKLKNSGLELSLTHKFSTSLLLIGVSFYALSWGILRASDSGHTSSIWLVLHFLLQAMGELLIAPVGFSMVGKLAPQRLNGVMMGFWMMVSGIAASLSQFFSNTVDYGISAQTAINNPNYLSFFDSLGFYAFLGAVVLLAISRVAKGLASKETELLGYSDS